MNKKWTAYMEQVARDTSLTSNEVSDILSRAGHKVSPESVRYKRHTMKVKCDYKGRKRDEGNKC